MSQHNELCISKFFELVLRAKLRVVRGSWGATDDLGRVILRAWDDESRVFSGADLKYSAFDPNKTYRQLLAPGYRRNKAGLSERLLHLDIIEHARKVDKTEIKGYMVSITAKDPSADTRSILIYDDAYLIPIGEVIHAPGGYRYGECLKPIPILTFLAEKQKYIDKLNAERGLV